MGLFNTPSFLTIVMDSMKLVITLHSLDWVNSHQRTKDESKRGTAFAFIFDVNWLWHKGSWPLLSWCFACSWWVPCISVLTLLAQLPCGVPALPGSLLIQAARLLAHNRHMWRDLQGRDILVEMAKGKTLLTLVLLFVLHLSLCPSASGARNNRWDNSRGRRNRGNRDLDSRRRRENNSTTEIQPTG